MENHTCDGKRRDQRGENRGKK